MDACRAVSSVARAGAARPYRAQAQQRTAGAAAKLAQFVATALQLAPPGIHIAAPETVWRAAQGDLHAAVRQWLRP